MGLIESWFELNASAKEARGGSATLERWAASSIRKDEARTEARNNDQAVASKPAEQEEKQEGGLVIQFIIVLAIGAPVYFLVPISDAWLTYGMYGILGFLTLGFCDNIWDKLKK